MRHDGNSSIPALNSLSLDSPKSLLFMPPRPHDHHPHLCHPSRTLTAPLHPRTLPRPLHAPLAPLALLARRLPQDQYRTPQQIWHVPKTKTKTILFDKKLTGSKKKTGTVVRIASNNYSLSSPAALKTIYAHGSPFTKSAFYDASRNPDAPRADLFSDRDPAAHASFRRRVAQLYSPSTVVRMEDEVRGCVRELLARLGEFAESGKRVDLQHWLQCYAFDVVGAVTVSRRFGFLDRGEDCLGLLEALHRSLVYLTHVGVVPEVHRWLYAVVKRVGRNGMSGLFAFAAGAVGERLREDEKGDVDEEGEDFLAKMVRMHRREPEKFGFLDMMMVCAMNVGAGSDSTSVALSAVMWFLLKNPPVMAKARSYSTLEVCMMLT